MRRTTDGLTSVTKA